MKEENIAVIVINRSIDQYRGRMNETEFKIRQAENEVALMRDQITQYTAEVAQLEAALLLVKA